MSGTYGDKNTFEDAKVTVTEFLDNFYDESKSNYNQAFLELERRLQEYFEYEHRDTENGQEEGKAENVKTVFAVYLSGMLVRVFDCEKDAIDCVRLYDGDKSIEYKKEVVEA